MDVKRKLKTINWVVFIEFCILLVFAFVDDIQKGLVLGVAKLGCLIVLLIVHFASAEKKEEDQSVS